MQLLDNIRIAEAVPLRLRVSGRQRPAEKTLTQGQGQRA